MARPGVDRLTPRIAPRLALAVVAVVFAGYLVNSFTWVIQAGATPARLLTSVALLATLMYLQLRYFSNPAFDTHSVQARGLLAVNSLLIYVPGQFFGQAWIGMAGFLAGNVLLVLRPAARWPAFAVITAANGVLQFRLTHGAIDSAYAVSSATGIGLVVYGLSRLRSLVHDQQRAREQLASRAIAQERLRFARDLHDLLGFSLSAITLKTELAHRFARTHPDRAGTELAEMLDVSRQALADVRSVASSYRELSLTDEVDSARSVLEAAEITTTVAGDPGELPPRIGTALATVLREGVTNLLRHSKAEHCTITFRRTGTEIAMDVRNDGARGAHTADGCGVSNLGDRAAQLGGSITAGLEEDDYLLSVRIPLKTAPAAPAPPRTSMAPAFARRIANALFTCFAFNSFSFAVFAWHGTAQTIFVTALILVSLALLITFFTRPGAPLRSPAGYAALATQAVLTALPIVLLRDPFLGLPGFLAGACLLVLPNRVRWGAVAAVAAGAGSAQIIFGGHIAHISHSLFAAVNIGLNVYAFTRMRALVQELHETREELAELAVTEERLRFARDLHDLLGFSLSAITLKTELTRRLITKDPDRAQQELTQVAEISRQALADIRAVAASYRALELDEEISAARSVLEAAEVDVTLRIDQGELTTEVRTVLATVVREGVTNLLRHSQATRCEIVLTSTSTGITLTITNDGAPEPQPGGSGIDNLTARVRAVRGTLHHQHHDGTYRFEATIPV